MPVEIAGNAMVRAPRPEATFTELRWQASKRDERSSVSGQTGPTVWTTHLAGSRPAALRQRGAAFGRTRSGLGKRTWRTEGI